MVFRNHTALHLWPRNTSLTQFHLVFASFFPGSSASDSPLPCPTLSASMSSASPSTPSVSLLISPSLTVLRLCPLASSTTSLNPIPLTLLRLSRGTIEKPGLIGPRPIDSPLPRTALPPRGGDNECWVSAGCSVERRRLRERIMDGDGGSVASPWRAEVEYDGDWDGIGKVATPPTVGACIRSDGRRGGV